MPFISHSICYLVSAIPPSVFSKPLLGYPFSYRSSTSILAHRTIQSATMFDNLGDSSGDDDNHKILILDGGTGEELFRQGVPDDRKIWSATALVHESYHDVLKGVHQSFLLAGADAITTNSYGVVPGVGFSEKDITRYGRLAGDIARQSVTELQASTKGTQRMLVLGSLGPLVESYRPDKIMEHSSGVTAYERMVCALQPSVDVFLAETMSSVEESMQAIEAVSHMTTPKPCLVSYTLSSDGKLRSDERVTSAIPRILDYAAQKKVSSVLFNCAEPEAITLALREIKADSKLTRRLDEGRIRLGAYANRLTPVAPNWSLAESDGPQEFRKDLDPQQYVDFVSTWIDELNVTIVGGCCGITPEHIAALKSAVRSR